uniref:Dendrocyte expressed seven transmembrane protein n=2 Tax=Tetraodon nigroviridis TaxID=99883 RepID=H3CS07_TETNG
WTLLTVLFFLSKRARCYGTLLVVSLFMKKSRNLLLTAGTSLVVFRNIHNTSANLSLLLKSMICNLKAKKAAIVAPLAKYKEMLKWVGNMLTLLPDLVVVKVDSHLSISTRLESQEFEAKLSEAEQELNKTVVSLQSVTYAVSSVTEKLFPAISFFVLMAFIVLHVKKFHNDMKYKNKFIGGRFEEFEEKRRAEGKAHVLPLTPEEKKLYPVLSIRPTFGDRKAMLKFSIPVMFHLLIWVVFVTVDVLSYWFVVVITTKLSELEPFNVHLLANFKNIVTLMGQQIQNNVQEEDFSFSVTLFERECLPTPELLLHTSVVPLAVILAILVIMVLVVSKVAQLRLLVCEQFFPIAAEARVEYLHARILKKRLKK